MPASAPIRARTSALPLRVVRRASVRSVARKPPRPLERSRAWKPSTASAEAAGIAADLVQREQPDVAVERGVLDALRHHRAGRLLEAHRRTRPVAALLQQQDRAQLARRRRRAPPPRGRRPRRRPRPARRRCGRRGSEASGARSRSRLVEQPPQPLDLGLERRHAPARAWPRPRCRRSDRALAGRAPVERRAARSAPGSTKSASTSFRNS